MNHALRERCLEALGISNVQAGLRSIREGETSQDASAYRRRWPGTGKKIAYFDDLSKHPRILEPGPNGPSSAAGAYQITMSTYDEFAPKLGITTFYEADQDLLAVAIIESCGALDDLIAGRFRVFLRKCAGRWASLPDSKVGQPTKKFETLSAVYEQWGGSFEDEYQKWGAPIEERDLSGIPPRVEEPVEEPTQSFDWSSLAQGAGAIASMFNPFVGAALTALSPLLRQKVEKAVSKHSDPETAKLVAANLSDVVEKTLTRTTGKADPIDALAVMRAEPAIVAKLEAAVDNRLDQLAPFIDKAHQISKDEWEATEKSMSASVERTNLSAIGAWVQKHVLIFAEVTVLLAMIFTGALIAYQMITKNGEEPSGQLIILFAMLVTMSSNTVRSIADWAYGSSKSSAGKDLMLEQQSIRRKQ